MEEIKVEILKFVQSLSKDEPFNGDEVGELSRYFVNVLCERNGEEDEAQYILKPFSP